MRPCMRYHSRPMNRNEPASQTEVAQRVASVVRPEIRALSAYHVQDASGMVKLDAMENPYALPADLRTELGALAGNAAFNRYPDPQAKALKARLAAVMGVPEGMELLLGNGSDEIIQLLAMACARPGAVLVGVEPSFVMFSMIATFCGLRFVGVPLTPDFRLDADAMIEVIQRERAPLVFIAYPNNPTGNLFDAAAIERVIAAAPGIVVVDEAYHPFAGASFLGRLAQYPNLLVMRTLSKLGLAGLRLGLLMGRREWIAELDKLRLPYNVNVLTQVVAERVLERGAVLDEQAAEIRSERGRLAQALRALPAVQVFDSDANFILFRVADAPRVFGGLKERGVLIKKLDGSHPMLAGCLRVTVGAPVENDAFVAALKASLAG
jgi:histidinol-phosphate aminotransferase